MLEKIKKELKQVETSIENIKEYVQIEQYKQIKAIFEKSNSPLERMPTFKKLDIKVRQIDDGVGFRITENSLVYEIKDQVFISINPQVNAIRVDHITPDGWKYIQLTDDNEIDGAIVLIKEACYFIREKKN